MNCFQIGRRLQFAGLVLFFILNAGLATAHGAILPTTDGFYGIWFGNSATGNQYGYVYSGGLGTYTHQTSPLAIYEPAVNRTYFVYGGTSTSTNNSLRNYISYYDHNTGLLARPREIRNVGGTDNHNNATFTIDDSGYIWVFGNTHGNDGTGRLYKSAQPYAINDFNEIPLGSVFNNDSGKKVLSYSNPFYVPNQGLMVVYNQYDDGRSVHVAKSTDGVNWTDQNLFANITNGHYTLARQNGNTIGVSADWHNPNLSHRTNLYYFQTSDFGQTWTTAGGNVLTTPLNAAINPALVYNYQAENKLVYMKDISYDASGQPILLYLTVSDETNAGHQPGPQPGGRTLHTAHWNGASWDIRDVIQTDHNYDHGELWVEPDGTWRIIAPFITGPQVYGAGGQVGEWTSVDQGMTWQFVAQLTHDTQYNHTYVRRPVDAHDGFYAYWANGGTVSRTPSRLFFSTKNGDVYRMPTNFTGEFAAPQLIWSVPEPGSVVLLGWGMLALAAWRGLRTWKLR